MQKLIISFLTVLIILSCKDATPKNTTSSFYHWKAKAEFTSTYQEALTAAKTNTIYLHYFDVEVLNKATLENEKDGVFPTYVLKSVDTAYQKHTIIPVVYITNQVLKAKGMVVADLAVKIRDLINQISKKQFKKQLKQIQLDCDWTTSTKNTYFELLNTLQKDFDIDVTIRLHQIKFKDRTGVPPVKSGTLMLYNMGNLKDTSQNSILQNSIVKQYINTETSYPIPLRLGLPIFSQTVVFNKDNKIKLIRNTEPKMLANDLHFKQLDSQNFEIVKDTLYKGFFLSKGFRLKLEELKATEVIAAYQTIKKSKLKTNEIIFYHLDKKSLSTIQIKDLISQLNYE